MPNIQALDRLKSQLLISGIQEKNQPLYQVINQLIDFLRQTINTTTAEIAVISAGGGGGGSGTVVQRQDKTIILQEEIIEEVIGVPGPPGPINALAPLLSIAQADQPGTLNVSTEGTIDWLVPNGTTTIPRQETSDNLHSKAIGGWLSQAFDWIVNAGTIFTQNDVMEVSSDAGDDTADVVLTNSTASQGISKAAGIDIGFRLNAPASPDRVSTLRIYCSVFSGEVTITASLPFNSLSQTLTFDSGANTDLLRMITIQYRGHGVLGVTARLTINRGSTPNVKFQAATLS